MRTLFFPVNTFEAIKDRHRIIMSEYHTYLGDEAPVWQLMSLSEDAIARREARIKAAQENKVYID
ncbi:hypothetical protein [Achromobacter phage Motura]|uniref:Uncharacterized protein n=1 Tax=Achromobacter phage Motura TaxID=2591403 RepID=A0A514CT53_9CAUD|nr:hypothetical protein H1O15_gp142 [Achromobacter phage Motura]QDH83646.1 hypothetical protein [Achromobacter phage Motura]